MSRESPLFAKTYDLLRWLLPATAKFPKQQRFVLARQIEERAFGFHQALFRVRAAPGAAFAEADQHLAALRAYLRLACDLRFLSVNQYEHAARLVDELGGSSAAGSGRPPGWRRQRRPLGAAVWGRALVLRGGSWNNNPINLRTANRNNNSPDNRNNNIGFRCASECP